MPLQEDGSYTLRGGPVEALIAYAASSTRAGRFSSTLTQTNLLVVYVDHSHFTTIVFAMLQLNTFLKPFFSLITLSLLLMS